MRKSWFYQHFVVSMKRAAKQIAGHSHMTKRRRHNTSAHSMFAQPVYGVALLLLLLIISIFIVTRTWSSSTLFIVLRCHENAVSCDCDQWSERRSGEWGVCIARSNRLMFNFNLARGQSAPIHRKRASSNPLTYSWLLCGIQLTVSGDFGHRHRSLYDEKSIQSLVVARTLSRQIDAVWNQRRKVHPTCDTKLPWTTKKEAKWKAARHTSNAHSPDGNENDKKLLFTFHGMRCVSCWNAMYWCRADKKVFKLSRFHVIMECCSWVSFMCQCQRTWRTRATHSHTAIWTSNQKVILIERKTFHKCWCLVQTNRIY